MNSTRSISTRWGDVLTRVALAILLTGWATTVHAQNVPGTEGPPANQNIPHGNPGISAVFNIVAAGPTYVSNSIPFGDNTGYGFTGFIYRNVPAFTIMPGSAISFDLGAENDQEIRRNIYLAVANMNPAPPVLVGDDVVSQGIRALAWTQVVSDAQLPLNPHGNFVSGDFELTYMVEAPFAFPGGGLIVGFSAAPPAGFPDGTCDQVLVCTVATDPSDHFYARFFRQPDLTLDVLDTSVGANGRELGGVVIREEATPVHAASWGNLKLHYR